MRLAFLCVLALALAPAAHATTPTVSASASARSGSAPLATTLRADGDAVSYTWQLGDSAIAEGQVVQHVYRRPGIYTATVTGVSAEGETAYAQVVVTASRLTLTAAARADIGDLVRFRGRLTPPLAGARVLLRNGKRAVVAIRARADGRFATPIRIGSPGPFTARVGAVVSAPVIVRIRPVLEARLEGARTVGTPLRIVARVHPAGAGRLRVEVRRGDRRIHARVYGSSLRVRLDTGRAAPLRIRVRLVPRPGYAAAGRSLAATVVEPSLAYGSRGASVRALEARLRQLHYAIRAVDGLYATDTAEAVLAFQKVEGLPWTGRVDTRMWRRLATARVPRARYGGDHLEVSKGGQYLLNVRDGQVAQAVHVSTGATGNTPIGRWQVYRKVSGWDWVLWYPMYFLRGFAIHGYPSVPAYPASHGCVRVPMWIAPQLYSDNPYGQTVYVYW